MRLDISSANSQTGKFVIVAQEAALPTPGVQLAPNESVSGMVQPNAQISYMVTADPTNRQILDVRTTDPQASLSVQLEDASGNVLASLDVQAGAGEMLIPTGTSSFAIVVNNPQDVAVGFTMTVLPINGLLSTPTQTATILPTVPVTLAPTAPTDCTVTPLYIAVNVRRGPSTRFDAFMSLQPGASLTAVARNADGSWYQVDTGNGLGWVAASVITSTGPCASLQVIFVATPTLPPATSTPRPTQAVAQHCAPYTFRQDEANGAYMTISLPQGNMNDVISFKDGYHTQYLLPTCRAMLWNSVSFTCEVTDSQGDLGWVLDTTNAHFDWNATCGSNTNTNQPGMSFGVR